MHHSQSLRISLTYGYSRQTISSAQSVAELQPRVFSHKVLFKPIKFSPFKVNLEERDFYFLSHCEL